MLFLKFLLFSVALVQYFTLTAETSAISGCPKGCNCSVHLQHVSCTNISLADIPSQLPSIISQLRLRSEDLPEIPANTFLNLSHLTTLYLNNNNIRRLRPGAFSGLAQLEFLHLNNNSLKELEAGVFQNATALAFLHLENNLLSDITPGVFSSLLKLNVLDLSNNCLTTIADLTFSGLKALRWLFLSNNQIRSISSRAFVGNRVLRKLYLDHNKLTTVSVRVLRSIKRLEILQISYNNISRLNPVAFQKLKFLTQLYLDNMLLEEVPSQVFYMFSKMEILSLRNNRLVTLSSIKHLKSVKWFGLSGNIWRCDCKLIWLQEWLLDQRAANQKEVMCSSPGPHSGKLLVDVQLQFLTCPPFNFKVTTTPSQTAKNKPVTPEVPPPQGTAHAFLPNTTTIRAHTVKNTLPAIPDPCLSNRIKGVTVSEVTTNSLLVNWKVQKDVGDVYEVRYSTATQGQSAHMIGGIREVELSQLDAGTVYKVCVIPQSNNKCHQPASSQCSEARTSGQLGHTESEQLGDKNGQYTLVGGITGIAVLITVVLIAAFKSRRTGFQRHYDEETSTYIEHLEIDQNKVNFDHINSAFEDVTNDNNVYFSDLNQSPKVEGK
ncbi:chondroadherin-like [Narcine bancroftii]|uniref:chondroadherin-like n=1 Tax=Narcine bancroftii TaxID=1343680 RepID=UPI003831C11E